MAPIIKTAATNVPYQKLQDEPKFGPLHVNIPPTRPPALQIRYRQQRQRQGARIVSCLLATLAFVIAFLVAAIVARTLINRCWRSVNESEAGDFNRFLNMLDRPPYLPSLQEEIQNLKPKHEVLDTLNRFGPGPARRPWDRPIQPARCSAVELIDCNRNSFDGYSLREHQDRVDLALGKSLLNGAMNTSYAVNNARAGFRRCIKDTDGEKQTILSHFVLDIMELHSLKYPNENPAVSMANITATYRQTFGIDTLMKIDVGPNYLAPDGDRPHVLYVDQKPPGPLHAGLTKLMREALSDYVDKSDIEKMFMTVPQLRELIDDSDESMNWQSFTVAEATARWPFFDFVHFFERLNQIEKFSNDLKREFIFVVKTPQYFDKLNAFWLSTNRTETQEKLKLFKLMSLYNAFDLYSKYLGVDGLEDSMQKDHQIGQSDFHSQPYHFIFTYGNGGHASYEALRFCSRDLRENLPDIASAVLARMVIKQPLNEEIQRFEGLIEATRNELIELLSHLSIPQSLRVVLMEKIRKIGISFSTRETLENDLFEEAHEDLNVDEAESYVDNVADQKRFLLRRKLRRLNSKVEAIRSAAFGDSSAAETKIEYSRIGNWLNIPGSILTSAAMGSGMSSPRAVIYSNIAWILGREMAKAIDSEGLMYNAVGVHRRGESDLEAMENIWTDALSCLRVNVRSSELVGKSPALFVRETLDEMIGFQVAYGSFMKAVEKLIGSFSTISAHADRTRKMSVKNFFQTSASTYCDLPARGGSLPLLDKFLDGYVKRRDVFNCSNKSINFECPVDLVALNKTQL
ncbi:hypothetical protein M3Y95_00615500 [Aphelenchoides besseyi]|nr:hypothetical protein M3Y95_00615500 [Aphelenchoides besseyi]